MWMNPQYKELIVCGYPLVNESVIDNLILGIHTNITKRYKKYVDASNYFKPTIGCYLHHSSFHYPKNKTMTISS